MNDHGKKHSAFKVNRRISVPSISNKKYKYNTDSRVMMYWLNGLTSSSTG
jgi:hypothetical protein